VAVLIAVLAPACFRGLDGFVTNGGPGAADGGPGTPANGDAAERGATEGRADAELDGPGQDANAGTIGCGSTTCESGKEFCCADSNSCFPVDGGRVCYLSFFCERGDDCGRGAFCCGYYSTGSEGASGSSFCAPDCGVPAGRRYRVCEPTERPDECAGSGRCQVDTTVPFLGVCE
jgi:hypothetical protein